MGLVLKVFVHEGGKLPCRGKRGDAGIDVFACLPDGPIEVKQFDVAKIPLGFSCSFGWRCSAPGDTSGPLEDAWLTRWWIDVRNRSGVGMKSGFAELSGVIDPSYRGVPHYCVAKVTPGAYTVRHGDKIAQILINPFVDPYDVEILQVATVEELGPSERGAQGFGASGT
jgi:dUTP pyrophosphatase